MQAGEVIWLLAGIGIGLTIAIALFAGVAFMDERRSRHRVEPVAAPEPKRVTERPAPKPSLLSMMTPAAREPKRAALAPLPAVEPEVASPAEPESLAPAMPPAPPAPSAREPIVADARSVQPAVEMVDSMMSDLTAEIGRLQSAVPEPVDAIEVAAVEPMVVEAKPVLALAPVVPEPPVEVIAEVVAAPEPVPIEPPKPADPPLVVAPDLAPIPTPRAPPPLPKVTPARKFAPALPPRKPPTPGS